MDAARMLPVLGFLLIMLPLMGSGSSAGNGLWLFAVWFALVAAAAALAGPLRRAQEREKRSRRETPAPR